MQDLGLVNLENFVEDSRVVINQPKLKLIEADEGVSQVIGAAIGAALTVSAFSKHICCRFCVNPIGFKFYRDDAPLFSPLLNLRVVAGRS